MNVRESFGVEHFRTRVSPESIPRANRIIAAAKTNTTTAIATFNIRGLTSLVPAWKRSRLSLASKRNDSHIGEHCRPAGSEETDQERRSHAETAAEADESIPDNRQQHEGDIRQ